MPLDDAEDLCVIYEATGRTIPRRKWVEEMIVEDEQDRVANSLDAMI